MPERRATGPGGTAERARAVHDGWPGKRGRVETGRPWPQARRSGPPWRSSGAAAARRKMHQRAFYWLTPTWRVPFAQWLLTYSKVSVAGRVRLVTDGVIFTSARGAR